MTAGDARRAAARHPPQRARDDPVPVGRRAAARKRWSPRAARRRRAGRGHDARRPHDGAAVDARRHRRLRLRAARRAARRLDRHRRPLAEGPADRAGRRARGRRGARAGGPARRARRPRRAHARRAAARRRGSAPARRGARRSCARSGLGLEVVDVRGNVDTRLRMVADGDAGRRRPGPRRPAPAGACRRGHRGLRPAAHAARARSGRARGRVPRGRRASRRVGGRSRELDDPATRPCVVAERALLARLEAGCAAPVGALADVALGDDGDELSLRAVVVSIDGAVSIRRSATRAARTAGAGGPPDPGTAAPSRSSDTVTTLA